MKKAKPIKFKQKRKRWYRALKRIIKVRYKEPKFIFLGEKPLTNSIILSNHVGTDAPMSLEIYAPFHLRMWGTHEINSGLRKMYRYQSRVYYHEKKGWNLHLARLFCLLASPLTNLFYKGLRLISTYQDLRLKKTVKESLEAFKDGDNIVIFPEVSDEGYLDELKGFHGGFCILAEIAYKHGIDTYLYASYFKIKEKVYLFDKPILYSELKKIAPTRLEMARYLVDKCNALGKLDLNKIKS